MYLILWDILVLDAFHLFYPAKTQDQSLKYCFHLYGLKAKLGKTRTSLQLCF